MTDISLRKNIQQAIDSIDDPEFLQAVFTIVSDKVKEQEYALTSEQLAILETREKKHLNGTSKSYKLSELKKALNAKK